MKIPWFRRSFWGLLVIGFACASSKPHLPQKS